MNKQFCRVGKIKPNLGKSISLKEVEKRKNLAYTPEQRTWQEIRRGRYVEFNLVWDRGTHFGLQSGGRTESILLSMPALVSWSYNRVDAPESAEAQLATQFLKPRDWV